MEVPAPEDERRSHRLPAPTGAGPTDRISIVSACTASVSGGPADS
jgi:hypothetical protein